MLLCAKGADGLSPGSGADGSGGGPGGRAGAECRRRWAGAGGRGARGLWARGDLGNQTEGGINRGVVHHGVAGVEAGDRREAEDTQGEETVLVGLWPRKRGGGREARQVPPHGGGGVGAEVEGDGLLRGPEVGAPGA